MLKPKKSLIEKADESGNLKRMLVLVSAAHILNCEANNLIEEASDLLKDSGLMLGDLKVLHKKFVRSADDYFKYFSELVLTNECKMDMFNDMDEFDKMFREWAKIEYDEARIKEY